MYTSCLKETALVIFVSDDDQAGSFQQGVSCPCGCMCVLILTILPTLFQTVLFF